MQLLEQAQDGVRLSVSTPEDDIRAAAAANDSLILEFEAFRDGRGFSLATVLRERGYRGQLIAAGKVLRDEPLDWNDYCRLVKAEERIAEARNALVEVRQ